MKKNLWWIIGIFAVAVILFSFGGGMMSGWGFRNGYGMMGDYGGYGAPGMMFNWGYSPLGWLGMGLGMLLIWGLPIGLIVLAGFGVASLFKGSSQATSTPVAQATCPNCAKNVQTDWQNCPYCGISLK